MVDNHEDKLAFLKLICRHVANTRCSLNTCDKSTNILTRCRPDPEELMAKMAATELGLDSSDLSVTSFSKAISSFNKTKQKVCMIIFLLFFMILILRVFSRQLQ